jgi:hypothetical protein
MNLLKNKLPQQVGSFRMAHSAFFEIPKDLTEEEKCQIRQKEEELKSRQGFFACHRVALIFYQFRTKAKIGVSSKSQQVSASSWIQKIS